MRYRLLAFLLFICGPLFAQGLLPFPAEPAPTFEFDEEYHDQVIPDPDFPGDYLTLPRSTLHIRASGSLTGFDIANVDEFTEFEITVGDFNFEGFVGDDSEYDTGDRIITFPIEGYNDEGDDVPAGSINISWTVSEVNLSVTVLDSLRFDLDPEISELAIGDYYPDIIDPDIDREDILATFSFGPYTYDTRTVYTVGTADSQPDPSGNVFENLSDVQLFGSIDSVAPVITITQPANNAVVTTNDVTPDFRYTIFGTVADTRNLNGVSYPGVVTSVEVRVGNSLDAGMFVPAQLDGSGNWVLPNVLVAPGKNTISVRAFDQHGNLKTKITTANGTTTLRNFTFTTKGDLTVTTAAAGYPVAANGQIAGTVTGSFFKTPGKKLTMNIGQPAPQDSQGNVESGQLFTVIAKPGPGSVFNGWTATINGTTVYTAVPEVFKFETKPDLVLTANFIPNPFAPTTGIYNGLLNGDTAAERGAFKLVMTKTGFFTGQARIGTLTLPLKGKFLGSGFWSGTVKFKNIIYTVTMTLTVDPAGQRTITGTITGGGLSTALLADLSLWKNKTNEATAYMGDYTVLLPPAQTNTDPEFPEGIGFARVKITKLGKVLVIGKLGDGSPAVASATLAKRSATDVTFPIFIALDAKKGNVAGIVTHDATQTDTDLTGTLDWVEPPTKLIEPQAFAGQIALHGSRYIKPAIGERVIFNASGGNGTVTLTAPPYSKPVTPPPTALNQQFPAVLEPLKQSVGPLGTHLVKFKFVAATGLFTGSFRDPAMNNKTIAVFGAASRKANNGTGVAAGVFIRGNRAGAIIFDTP